MIAVTSYKILASFGISIKETTSASSGTTYLYRSGKFTELRVLSNSIYNNYYRKFKDLGWTYLGKNNCKK